MNGGAGAAVPEVHQSVAAGPAKAGLREGAAAEVVDPTRRGSRATDASATGRAAAGLRRVCRLDEVKIPAHRG